MHRSPTVGNNLNTSEKKISTELQNLKITEKVTLDEPRKSTVIHPRVAEIKEDLGQFEALRKSQRASQNNQNKR